MKNKKPNGNVEKIKLVYDAVVYDAVIFNGEYEILPRCLVNGYACFIHEKNVIAQGFLDMYFIFNSEDKKTDTENIENVLFGFIQKRVLTEIMNAKNYKEFVVIMDLIVNKWTKAGEDALLFYDKVSENGNKI